MTKDESKLEILKKVEDGVLSVEEGAELLGILDRGTKITPEPEILPPAGGGEDDLPLPEEHFHASGCWRAAWSMVLAAGAILTAFSAYWVYQGYQKAGLGWGFWLSWIPFVVGILITVFGFILLESPFLHLRVKSREGRKTTRVVFSMPVPIKFGTWVFRTFGHWMPEDVKKKGIEEMMEEIDQSIKRGEPFHIEVDDNKDGSKVLIHIE